MITPGNLLLTTVIVVLLVGTKKLRNVGSDLGAAVKSFREALNSSEAPKEAAEKISDQTTKSS